MLSCHLVLGSWMFFVETFSWDFGTSTERALVRQSRGSGFGSPECHIYRVAVCLKSSTANRGKRMLALLRWSTINIHLTRYDLVLEVISVAFLQNLTSRSRHSFDPNTFKLAVCNVGIGLCKSYISIQIVFRAGNRISGRSISWPAHYKSMRENS